MCLRTHLVLFLFVKAFLKNALVFGLKRLDVLPQIPWRFQ